MTSADRRAEVLVVSLGTTGGWRSAASELVAAFRRAGVPCSHAEAEATRPVRTFAVTDLVQARAARRAALTVVKPAAVVYCSITAALLWPIEGAIWLDATAAENRPGRHGLWQRPLERVRLQRAPLVMTMAARTLEPYGDLRSDAVLVPSPVEPSAAANDLPRDVDAITYAGDPEKKRMDVILEAWSQARREHETLIVAGTDQLKDRPGVRVAGRLPPAEYRALLRRAKTFIAAPRREDYGIAPLEALADGCLLVTTPAPGPYPALGLARELDPRLVTDDLPRAIRLGLDDPSPGYAGRARELLGPFRRSAVDETIRSLVLPRLLPAPASASA